ncbi:MAG: twin-arginine translocase TatA/TatE family subunit [Deltaproteobacteria bacterium]|nr:twin-arginine translocase TatA/TatE family subunit [Deltaproteobacteria bacterium]
MFGIGWSEVLIILVVALLVLGPTRLPDIARGLGKGLREFKRAVNSLDDDSPPPRQASHQVEVRRELPQAPPAAAPGTADDPYAPRPAETPPETPPAQASEPPPDGPKRG